MASDNTARLAVLIDADNAQPSITEGLLAEVAKYGTAHVKRAYGFGERKTPKPFVSSPRATNPTLWFNEPQPQVKASQPARRREDWCGTPSTGLARRFDVIQGSKT